MPIANYTFSETSPAAAGTLVSSQPVIGADSVGVPNGVVGLLGDFEALEVVAELQGATGGTLNVYLQNSVDEGVKWFDVVAWPQLTSAAALIYYQSPLSNSTTTSQTQVVGKNLVPALNSTPSSTAPNVVNGAFTDRLRLVMVAGSGTSAGAPVIVHVTAQRGRTNETGS